MSLPKVSTENLELKEQTLFNELVAAYIMNAAWLDQSISLRIYQCADVECLAPYWCSEGSFHHLQ